MKSPQFLSSSNWSAETGPAIPELTTLADEICTILLYFKLMSDLLQIDEQKQARSNKIDEQKQDLSYQNS